MKQDGKKVGLVIGSGSVKCAAALGLQRVLKREGIDINLVVGCSGGSLFAALIALGIEVEEAVELTQGLWTREITSSRNRRSLLQMIFPRQFGFDESFGLRDDRLIKSRLERVFGGRSFEHARIPLYITATDFHTGEQVVFSDGSLVDAIRASIAIPFIFPAYRVGARTLTDGALSDPLPVGVAIVEGANIILAIGFESPYQSSVDSAIRFAFQLGSIMTNNLLHANFAFHNLAHHSEVIPIVPDFRERISLFDTEKIPYVIEEGERATEEQVPYLRRLLELASDAGQIPS